MKPFIITGILAPTNLSESSLKQFTGRADVVVLALSRGGVPLRSRWPNRA